MSIAERFIERFDAARVTQDAAFAVIVRFRRQQATALRGAREPSVPRRGDSRIARLVAGLVLLQKRCGCTLLAFPFGEGVISVSSKDGTEMTDEVL